MPLDGRSTATTAGATTAVVVELTGEVLVATDKPDSADSSPTVIATAAVPAITAVAVNATARCDGLRGESELANDPTARIGDNDPVTAVSPPRDKPPWLPPVA